MQPWQRPGLPLREAGVGQLAEGGGRYIYLKKNNLGKGLCHETVKKEDTKVYVQNPFMHKKLCRKDRKDKHQIRTANSRLLEGGIRSREIAFPSLHPTVFSNVLKNFLNLHLRLFFPLIFRKRGREGKRQKETPVYPV